MTVGILAFSRCTNYGALLQIYALQETIRSMGHVPRVIDLWSIPNNKYALGVVHNPYVGIGTRLKGLRKWLTSSVFRCYERRYPAFLGWAQKHLDFTDRHWRTAEEFAKAPPDIDVLEVGSDQVFAATVSKLFLCTDVPPSLPRFSYGASFGIMDKTEDEKQRLRAGLSKFESLSARERSGVDLIRELLDIETPWVVDPVLLADRAIWRQMASANTVGGGVLVYWIGSIGPILPQIERLGRKLNEPVTVFVSQLADAHIPRHGEGVTIRWDATPTEFVASFSRAHYVLSNSFHAMMFSIIFERRAAFVVPPNSVKERFEVVKMFGCDKALLPKWDTGTEIQFVDFAGVYRKMDGLRTASRDFLEMALAKAGSKR